MRAGTRRLVPAALVAMLALGGAGCDTLDGAQGVADRSDLVADLAARLGQADQLTYTADYQLAGGAPATIAAIGPQGRAAYSYPGGKLVLEPGSYTDCRGTSCSVSRFGSPDPGPPAALLSMLGERGMITPPLVVNLLNATALDSDASVEQRDTTIAGQHATCVNVAAVDNAPASTFEVCVTTDGVIGSFTGVVNGTPVESALTQYRTSVAPTAFDLPAGARPGGTRRITP